MVVLCIHGLLACLSSAGVSPQKVFPKLVGDASHEFASSLCNARQLHAELVLLRQFQRKHVQGEVAEEHFHLGVDIALPIDKGVAALAEAKLVEIMLDREPEFLESVRLDISSSTTKTLKGHCWARLRAVQKAVSAGMHFSSTMKDVHDKFLALSKLPGDQLAAGSLAERDVDDMIVDKLQEIAWPFMYGVLEHDGRSDETKLRARQFLRNLDSLPRKSLASRQFMTMVFSNWLRRADFTAMREKLQKARREQQLDVVAAVFRTWSHAASAWPRPACASNKGPKRVKKGLLLACRPQAVMKYSFKAWQAATEVTAFHAGKPMLRSRTTVAEVFGSPQSTEPGDSDYEDDVSWPASTEARPAEQQPSKPLETSARPEQPSNLQNCVGTPGRVQRSIARAKLVDKTPLHAKPLRIPVPTTAVRVLGTPKSCT